MQPCYCLLWILKVKSTRSSDRVSKKLVNGFWSLFQQGLNLLHELLDSLRVCALSVIIPYLLIAWREKSLPDRLIKAGQWASFRKFLNVANSPVG